MGAESRQVALGNAERVKGAPLAYETCHGLPFGTSTIRQIERLSAGIAVWAEYASVIESYNGQKLMGLLGDCQAFDAAENIRKADAHCQKLLKHTGVTDMIEERCNSRSALTPVRSRLGVLPTSSIQLCETADSDGLDINMNEDWCDVEL